MVYYWVVLLMIPGHHGQWLNHRSCHSIQCYLPVTNTALVGDTPGTPWCISLHSNMIQSIHEQQKDRNEHDATNKNKINYYIILKSCLCNHNEYEWISNDKAMSNVDNIINLLIPFLTFDFIFIEVQDEIEYESM